MHYNKTKKLLILASFLPVCTFFTSCKNYNSPFSFTSSFTFNQNTKILNKTVNFFEKDVRNPISWKYFYNSNEANNQSFLFDLSYTINQKCKENRVTSNWNATISFDMDNFNKTQLYSFEYSIVFDVPQTFGIFANVDKFKEKINNYELKFITNNDDKNVLNFECSEEKDENSWKTTKKHRFDTDKWIYDQNQNPSKIDSFVLNNQDQTSFSTISPELSQDTNLKIFRFSFGDTDLTEEKFIDYFNNSDINFKKKLIVNSKEFFISDFQIEDLIKQIIITETTEIPWTETVKISFFDFVKIKNSSELIVENCKIDSQGVKTWA